MFYSLLLPGVDLISAFVCCVPNVMVSFSADDTSEMISFTLLPSHLSSQGFESCKELIPYILIKIFLHHQSSVSLLSELLFNI